MIRANQSRILKRHLPGLLFLLLPLFAVGQAGSSPPLKFHAENDRGISGAASSARTARLPANVIKLARDERYLLWVDLEKGRLSILARNDHGGMDIMEEIPVSIGKNGFGKNVEGDRKTPIGVYRLTSFLTDDVLLDEYGLGAFPLNYPNIIDRQAGRTGSGIWLHGLPKNVNTRPLQDSDGCVVVDNDSLMAMHEFIRTGMTHMILSDRPLNWVPVNASGHRRAGLEKAFDAWRQAWQEKDNDAYLGFYASDFSDFRRNKRQWSDYKRRVNNGKRWIEVSASELSFFADLKQPDLVTVRYYQKYASDNYHWSGWKEQLWRDSGDGWKIVYEGNG